MDGLWDWHPFSLFWVNSGFTCLKDMNADHLKSLALFGGSVVFFQWGERPRMESPMWLQIFGQAFWCKKVWGMETPLVIDQVLAGLLRLIFAKTTRIQPILTKQVFKHFVLATTFLQVKNLPVLTVFVYDDFKKCPSKPRFANDLGFSSPKFILKKQQITIESKLTKNSGISIWSPRHRFCSQIAARETKSTNQISNCLNLFFWLGSRAGGQPFYTQKMRANLKKKILWFFFLGMETHWVN